MIIFFEKDMFLSFTKILGIFFWNMRKEMIPLSKVTILIQIIQCKYFKFLFWFRPPRLFSTSLSSPLMDIWKIGHPPRLFSTPLLLGT